MQFSIITPSYRNAAWLPLCISSVADQDSEVEHIVQDACSDDGTQELLSQDRRVRAYIEQDRGMYDAVNRGFGRANGEILAYLNCDEQYLPGALRTVETFFKGSPGIDVALFGTVVVDEAGAYMCHRHSMTPDPHGIWFRFPVLTSSLFIRRKVFHDSKLAFDARWRALGDFHWVLGMLKRKVPMAVINSFTSSFTDSGDNMCLKPIAVRETSETLAMAPSWVRRMRAAWIAHHRLRRLAAGHFALQPTEYAIYTRDSPAHRVTFGVPHPTAIWRSRL